MPIFGSLVFTFSCYVLGSLGVGFVPSIHLAFCCVIWLTLVRLPPPFLLAPVILPGVMRHPSFLADALFARAGLVVRLGWLIVRVVFTTTYSLAALPIF
jgi:hypothetical protein